MRSGHTNRPVFIGVEGCFRCSTQERSVCSRSPAAIPTPTTRPVWVPIRFTRMLLDRDPVTGLDLASQPTLSRFENAVGAKQLYRMGEALAASVIERHAQRLHNRARLVTIDLDPTDDPTHGTQQLSFFNTHYNSWCYLPVMGFVTFNDEAEQYLCAAVLRPGNVTAPAGAVGILRRLLMMVRHFFPGVRIRIRLDGGF